MAVGELLLSAFFQVLFDRLASRELLNFASQAGLRLNLNEWEQKLLIIQAVLRDAEEKQLTDRMVKIWLDNLQDLAYEVEDILDEFATETLERKLMAEAENRTSTCKVKNLFPACFTSFTPGAIRFNVQMGSQIEAITSRLEQLCKQKTDLGLQIRPVETSITSANQRLPSTSVPTEPAVYGRDEDKAKILEMVLMDEPSGANFRVVPIVGMAGVGKTTLAREVYNDKAVEDFKFDIKAWVCVSDDFDVMSISKALIESITSSSCNLNTLNEVQVQLKNKVDGKKFLLVLDDVWNENYGLWENLKSPFMAGARGSKIIVTTRDADVASTMGPMEHYNLKFLSGDDCWSIFVEHAFESRDDSANSVSKLIQKKVVEKCGGLPLAARTLGGLLRSKRRDDEWEEILNSKIWDLPEKSGILPVLQVSYHHLPSHLKRCFAYCAIFPKDYEFEEKELVLLWIAEGIIQPSNNNKPLEDLGSEHFHDLVSKSIFQQSNSDNSKFVMHDLVHDMAQSFSGETSIILEEVHQQSRNFGRAHQYSYICDYINRKRFGVFGKVECLRTFLPSLMSGDRGTLFITDIVFSELLPKFKKLRVLSLERSCIVNLPDSIRWLRHLRYLNLAGTRIKALPKSTSSLFNLQILILRGCYNLVRLPSDMRNLINLRHLDITGASLLKAMPLGMERLKYLHTLSDFIVSNSTGSGLKDLKNLQFLRGQLCISGLSNSQDIRETILSDKKDLEKLILGWGPQSDNSENEEVESNLLDILQPHKNLRELTIRFFGGVRFASWVGNPSFSNMVVLCLEFCNKCTSLPALGRLSLLKHLTINEMASLKIIGSEIYGKDCSNPFQSLETLRFSFLEEWEYWDTSIENEQVKRFPRLRELVISYCPKLTGKIPDHLPLLENLHIGNCDKLVVSLSSFPLLYRSCIYESKGVAWNNPTDSLTLSNFSKWGNWLKQDFQGVGFGMFVDCEKIKSLRFWKYTIHHLPKPLQNLDRFTSLRELHIANDTSLISFPEVNFIPFFSSLKITNCDTLEYLPEIMKHHSVCIESLEIEDCGSLTFIERSKLPLSLKNLRIRNCKKLLCSLSDCISSSSSSFVMYNEGINTTCTSLLDYLSISKCISLTCVSRGPLPMALKHLEIMDCSELTTLASVSKLPESLEHLSIDHCSKLESITERFHSNQCLTSITLVNCEKLKSIARGLHNLSCLERIYIKNCPSFDSFSEGQLPSSILDVTIIRCEKLRALPDQMHNLNSLKSLIIWQCASIICFPEEGFPTSLKALSISDLKIYKPIVEWGLHKLTSLEYLKIGGCPDAVSFPHKEMGMMLPDSLTGLCLLRFPKLKYISSEGFPSLSSLEFLWIENCPKLTSFPTPYSLLHLFIRTCPLLEKQWKRNNRKEFSKIAHIPFVEIHGKVLYN